ncbi:MAG: NlpC/P60 family protein [Candidatus Eremiobacteraeota bacterium]|nr:NlpC/P60 family protein [Candidatus Eremiobacteraeota bacterium]
MGNVNLTAIRIVINGAVNAPLPAPVMQPALQFNQRQGAGCEGQGSAGLEPYNLMRELADFGGPGGPAGMNPSMTGNQQAMMAPLLQMMMQMLQQMMQMLQQCGMGGGQGMGCPGAGGGQGCAPGESGGFGGPQASGMSDPSSQGTSGLADTAARWGGRSFKPGQTKRCADFVSTMIEQSGMAPRGFNHPTSCDQLQKFGAPVGRSELRPGDVVFFGNTYRRGKYTHTGIYLGNGQFVHRPTANKPVRIDNISDRYYASRFSGGRRLQ